MPNDVCSLLQYQTELFHCLKNAPMLPCSSLSTFPEPGTTTDFFTTSIVLPFPQCHIIGVRKYKAFSDWFLLLRVNLSFFHVFFVAWNLISFAHNNIPFYGYFIVCLSVHLLQDIVVASTFGNMNKGDMNIHVQVLCRHKFFTSLTQYLGLQLLDYMVRLRLFCYTILVCLGTLLLNYFLIWFPAGSVHIWKKSVEISNHNSGDLTVSAFKVVSFYKK